MRARHEGPVGAVASMAARGVNAPLTSSAGRLFDAVSALLGVRDTINYEGQAAIELEQLADPVEPGCYRRPRPDPAGEPFPVARGRPGAAAGRPRDLARGVSARRSSRPGSTTAWPALIEDACVVVRERRGLDTVALSGGVFQNLLLADRRPWRGWRPAGFRVLTHAGCPATTAASAWARRWWRRPVADGPAAACPAGLAARQTGSCAPGTLLASQSYQVCRP